MAGCVFIEGLLVSCLVLATGCGGLTEGNGDGGGGATGYGRPTLQITVSGTTTGELTPGPSSWVDVIDQRDLTTGQLVTSTISVFAIAQAASAEEVGCALSFQSLGARVQPIVAGSYQVAANAGGTAFTSLAPFAAQAVTAGLDGWQCAGSGCDGAVLSLLSVGVDHVEGFFSGRLARVGTGIFEEVVCSFYVRTRTFDRR